MFVGDLLVRSQHHLVHRRDIMLHSSDAAARIFSMSWISSSLLVIRELNRASRSSHEVTYRYLLNLLSPAYRFLFCSIEFVLLSTSKVVSVRAKNQLQIHLTRMDIKSDFYGRLGLL